MQKWSGKKIKKYREGNGKFIFKNTFYLCPNKATHCKVRNQTYKKMYP